MSLITVIGRGHGGTRAMSHTLSASGVYMGEPINESGDLIPAESFYEACRVFAGHVKWLGDLKWDFSETFTCKIDPEFLTLVDDYLQSVNRCTQDIKGWKLPETTLAFPWIARLYPDAKYIIWIRDPRDSIMGAHVTDDLRNFGIEYPLTDDIRQRRAISWKYQDDLVRATPKPSQCISVRFEDFVLKQEETLARLEGFLGIPLNRIPVRKNPIGRWKNDDENHDFDFLLPALKEYNYISD
jgi:hypothetical protein